MRLFPCSPGIFPLGLCRILSVVHGFGPSFACLLHASVPMSSWAGRRADIQSSQSAGRQVSTLDIWDECGDHTAAWVQRNTWQADWATSDQNVQSFWPNPWPQLGYGATADATEEKIHEPCWFWGGRLSWWYSSSPCMVLYIYIYTCMRCMYLHAFMS